MKTWPIVRHLRYAYWRWRAYRHVKRYGGEGLEPRLWVSTYTLAEWLQSVWEGYRHPEERRARDMSIEFNQRPRGEHRADDIGRSNHRSVVLDGVHVLDIEKGDCRENKYWSKKWHVKHLPEDGTPFWIRRIKLSEHEYESIDNVRMHVTKALRTAIAAGVPGLDYTDEEHQLRIRQSELCREVERLGLQLGNVKERLKALDWLD